MADLTTTSYLILGMLSTREWTAYDLAKQMERGLGEVWPRAERQLYNAPKRLVADGYIAARKEPTGRRERTVYSITPAGRTALEEWMRTAPRPSALEFEGLLRVILADQGSVEELRQSLRTMAEQASAQRERFVENAAFLLANDGGSYPERQHVLTLANRFMVGHFTHIIEWAEWALSEVEDWPDTVTPAASQWERSRVILEDVVALATPMVPPDRPGPEPE